MCAMTERDDGNQRSASRQVVYVVAEIVTEAGAVRSALTHDASAAGLLLLTRAKLEIGQTVRLRVYVHEGDAPAFDVTGRVVRREPLAVSESDLWHHKVAVALDAPSSKLATELESLARKQAEIYGSNL